jgi:hypothetical protein
MSRCYHCGKILSDEWIKREGARMMGKTSGESKARNREAASKAAKSRWAKRKKPKPKPPKPKAKKRKGK